MSVKKNVAPSPTAPSTPQRPPQTGDRPAHRGQPRGRALLDALFKLCVQSAELLPSLLRRDVQARVVDPTPPSRPDIVTVRCSWVRTTVCFRPDEEGLRQNAQLAAEAAEAAAAQGAFWEMHDVLLGHQRALGMSDLALFAGDLGLDVDRFVHDVQRHDGASRIAEDVDGADSSGVSGTPSFFVNGRRYEGAYDIAALRTAAKTARVRAAIGSAAPVDATP